METKTTDIDRLEEGSELDALVAEKVMGAQWVPYTWYDGSAKLYLLEQGGKPPKGDDFDLLEDGRIVGWNMPEYSSDMAAAWRVVEYIWKTKQMMIELERSYGMDGTSKGWSCRFGGFDDGVYALADTMPLAICRAALKAVLKP